MLRKVTPGGAVSNVQLQETYVSCVWRGASARSAGSRVHATEGKSWCSLWYPTCVRRAGGVEEEKKGGRQSAGAAICGGEMMGGRRTLYAKMLRMP